MEGIRVTRTNNNQKKTKRAGYAYRVRAPNSAWHQAAPMDPGTLEVDLTPAHDPPRSAHIRPRMGWSLAIASLANVMLGSVAIATGATVVGIVACSALSIATCGLVLAEIGWHYRLDLGYQETPPDRTPLDRTPNRTVQDHG